MKAFIKFISIAFIIVIVSCTSMPKGAELVTGFEKEKFLGQWFEIARLDHAFEKDLEQVTADYSLSGDGEISVWNRGYNPKKAKTSEIKGTAKFAQNDTIGQLKVSFFGPFYASYNIISIDSDYNYALVAGNNLNYLWLLSRNQHISEPIREKYLSISKELGYNTNQLIWVKH